ncbi:MAG: hypothetical protein ACI4XL_10965 [Bacillus sp. (in: firmicutes)]
MDIRQYYKSVALLYINASIASACIGGIVFFAVVFLYRMPYVWQMVTPFMLLSLVYFIKHLLFTKKSIVVPVKIEKHTGTPLEEKDILLTFLPSPSLRALLFHPEGRVIGEITDENRSWYRWLLPNSISFLFQHTYVLRDQSGNRIATYKAGNHFAGWVRMYNGNGELVGMYEEKSAQSWLRYKGVVMRRDGSEDIPVNVNGFLQSFSVANEGGNSLFHFQKGYMPGEWSASFSLNTPILSFPDYASKEDRICMFGLCTRLFNHRSN